MIAAEARQHGRIEIELPCRLASAADPVDGLVVNLGLGGALVRAPVGLAEPGQSLGLEIDREEPALPLLLMAEVVRARARDGFCEYGLRFLPGPPSLQEELASFVSALASSRAGAGAKVHRRLEVRCAAHEAFRATLLDVCRGGLTLSSAQPVSAGEVLDVVVSLEGLSSALTLRGRVTASALPPPSGAEGPAGAAEAPTHVVSLAFDPPSPAEAARIDQLVRLLLLVGQKPSRAR